MNLEQRLKDLEQRSADLQMPSPQREAVWNDVVRYCENYLDYLENAPAFSPLGDMGETLLDSPFTPEGIPMHEALAMLRTSVDRKGHNTAAAGFLSYVPVSPTFPSMLGDLLAAVASRYAGHFNAGPGAVRMEHMVQRWMADVVGYPQSSTGNLTSGGSLANLIGIVCARTASGIRAKDFDRSVVYMTEHTHHCVDKALCVAGLDECIVRKVPTDAALRMDATALERLITEDRAASFIPLIVVANAGTTDSGAVDPLEDIARISRANKVWFHVDGSYGGFFALTPDGKTILKGIDQCDSLALDPPKGLYVPWGCGAVLVRDGNQLYETFKGQGAYMLDVTTPRDVLSPSDLSPELSKLSRGLRIWLPLKLFGTAPFEAAIEEKLLLAKYAWEKLRGMEGFECGPEPDLSIVMFRALAKEGDSNEFNMRIVKAIEEDGRIHVSSTTIHGVVYLRLAVLGFRTHTKTIDLALELLRQFADRLDC